MTGKIKKLTDKGFGFITPDECKGDIFFHAKGLSNVEFDALQEGDKVEFETEESEKGKKAVRIFLK